MPAKKKPQNLLKIVSNFNELDATIQEMNEDYFKIKVCFWDINIQAYLVVFEKT